MEADLFQTLAFIAPLSAGLQKAFGNYIVEETYAKKHRLLDEGQVCKRVYFIKKGFARAYYLAKDGKECTCWFMGTGDIMISVYSFLTQRPAAENIEILEDSIIQSISWNQLQSIYADFPEYNYIGRIVTEKYYILSEERALLLRTSTAEERYHLLLKTHPGILQKASLGQIASYLCISQETLSRVRGRKSILT
ncbi:Crp/Fnr family transcriptional regulator [Mucilaginibacter sp.]|uniref:Crp/Fnr family transcriptional regulator n=1 Tax=Mucilaginibacter sp. TaxID=1882438 RepID=UPI0032641A41